MHKDASTANVEPSNGQPSTAETNNAKETIPEASFGPWMIATRRPRHTIKKPENNKTPIKKNLPHGSRFNPILETEDAEDMEQTALHSKHPQNQEKPDKTSSTNTTTTFKAKGKTSIFPKKPKAIPVRKPLTVSLSDFPILFRNTDRMRKPHPGASTSHTTALDKTKHSAVALDENADPTSAGTIIKDGLNTTYENQISDDTSPVGDPPDSSKNTSPRSNNLTSTTTEYVANSDITTEDLTFSDLINASGDWDIAKLQSIFTDEAISHIMGFKSPDPTDIDDSIIWPANNKNLFNIRSAHKKLASPLWDPKSPTWKTIWSLQVPQRLRLFAWLAYKQKLMTNSERCRRSIGSQPFCSICNLSEETTLHVLRDCATAKSVWMQLLEPTSVYNFFHSNLQEWNDTIFKAISHDPQEIASRSLTWARYYHNCKPPSIPPRKHPLPPSRWQEPEPDWICLNVDAAVSPKSSSGSIGGVFRNHTGSWILGFQKQIGIVSILQAELWAIFIGLQIAWEQNFLFVTVQSDSMEAVNLLKKSQTSPSSLPLVRAIENLRKRSWELSIHWTPRQGNNVADALARQQDPHRKDLIIHEEPPPAILQFLNNDILSLSLQ
ncbi:hypothetical protein GQ457_01G038400 [Hibiscus cannabinus]